MKPMLDPDAIWKAVVRDQVAVERLPSDQTGDRVADLGGRV